MNILNIAKIKLSLLLAAGGALALSAGCGGGASQAPSIVVKPAESGGGPANTHTDETPNGTATAEGYGTFTGKVVVQGTPPTPGPVVLKGKAPRDPAVCAATADIPSEEIVTQNGGLANVFIYLRRVPKNGKPAAASPAALEFDQKGCAFTPHALVAQTGQTITVKNSDPVSHNVKTKPLINQEYNQILKLDETSALIYASTESRPVRVECNFHNWMRAYHLPLDHPYGTVTKADGSFTIPDLPVGTHYFIIWHERAGQISQRFPVEIKQDGDVFQATIEVSAGDLQVFRGPKPKTIKLAVKP